MVMTTTTAIKSTMIFIKNSHFKMTKVCQTLYSTPKHNINRDNICHPRDHSEVVYVGHLLISFNHHKDP